MSRKSIADALTAAFVLGALVVSCMMVSREFFPRWYGVYDPDLPPPPPSRSLFEPGLIDQLASTGWRTGAARGSRAVRIVEFADFQCPSCRAFAPVLAEIIAEQSGTVSLTYHHNPIERIHPHAFNAAVAFECAVDQGRGEAMHHELYQQQDALGKVSWSVLAAAAGVPSQAEFDRCIHGPAAAARVRADAHMARSLALEGTPTILVGHTLVLGAIGPDSLRALLRAERAR